MTECPACEAALDPGADQCPECGLSLTAVAMALSLRWTTDGMLVLAEFSDRMEAEMLIQRLTSMGIQGFLSGAASGITGGPIDLARLEPIRVLIWRQDGAAAVQMLAEDGQWTDDELARYMSLLDEAPGD